MKRKEVVALDPVRVLDRLQSVRNAMKAGSLRPMLPLMTLHLTSGAAVLGHLIDYDARRPPGVIAMSVQTAGTSSPSHDVLFVGAQSVIAIALHGDPHLADWLGDPVPVPKPEPSRGALSDLHVKRLSSRLSNALSEACGREGSVFVLLDADAATGDLAELVGQALDGLCRDDLGRQAVAAAIQQVEITATASAASITLAQGTLKVQGAYRLADLVERLESLL